MRNRAYYILNPNDEQATDVDNPDQRITDDTRSFTAQSLHFTLGVFDALLTFSLNILILWSISITLTLSLFGYAAFATSVLLISGRKLVRIDFDQLRYEADFAIVLLRMLLYEADVATFRSLSWCMALPFSVVNHICISKLCATCLKCSSS